jgi:hypothetical protein
MTARKELVQEMEGQIILCVEILIFEVMRKLEIS